MKKCPYCAEDIQDQAVVCKHCGRELGAPGAKKLKRSEGWYMWNAIAFLSLVLFVLGLFFGVLSHSRFSDDLTVLAIVGAIGLVVGIVGRFSAR